MPRRGVFKARIAEYTARLASGIEDRESFDSNVLSRSVVEAIKRVSARVAEEREGRLYCTLCGRGPFTRRGLYLHLVRVHYSTLIDLVMSEAERIYSTSKRLGA